MATHASSREAVINFVLNEDKPKSVKVLDCENAFCFSQFYLRIFFNEIYVSMFKVARGAKQGNKRGVRLSCESVNWVNYMVSRSRQACGR